MFPFKPRLVNRSKSKSNAPSNIPYKKLLIESQQAAYFEIPKVACTSINLLLIRKFIRTETFDYQHVHTDTSLPTVFESLDASFDSWFKFAFVRHPLTRLQSCFLDKVKPIGFDEPGHYESGLYVPFKKYGDLFAPGMNFEAFSSAVAQISDQDADPHFRSQTCFLIDGNGELQLDFLGRFENLEPDLDHVMKRFGVPESSYQLPAINKQEHPKDWALSSRAKRDTGANHLASAK